MAYDSLKNLIRQYIKTNGEQEITGQIMQNVLIEMVNQYPSTEGFIRANLSNLANGDILIYDSVGAWYNTPLSSFFNGYATQLWVNQQGYVTSSALAGYIHPTITDLTNGDILIWDSVGAWVNAPLDSTISGFGYVKSTGSVAYATSAGSANILGHSVYENPAHSLANGDMLVYDSGTGWTNVETSSILSGYATQSWVTSQGYITSSALNGYATQSWVTSQGYIQPTLSNLANGDVLIYDSVGSWVNTNLNTTISGFGYITSSALSGYATETWVTNQGYITSSALNGYATESWVNQQGFLTSSALNGYIHPTLTNLANGDILIYDSVGAWVNASLDTTVAGFGYATQSWVNTQLAGYLPLTGGKLTGASSQYVNVLQICADQATRGNSVGITFGHRTNGEYYTRIASVLEDSTPMHLNPSLVFYTMYNTYLSGSEVERMRIHSNGNVGIGTSTPAYKLDVNGTLNATTIYQNGTAISSIYLAPNLSNLANGDILVYDTVGAWYNTSLSSFGFATQTWVGQQGYLTSSALAGYIHPTLTNLANGDILIYDSVGAWVNTNLNTTVAGFGYITSSALANYLPLSGGTMSGGINFGFENKVCIDFRSNLPQWGSKIEMMGRGNDAIVWANRQSVTSFMFFQGIDLPDTDLWYSLGTPAMQIKQNCVAINKLITSGVTPSYTLDVNGTLNATTIYQNGTALSNIFLTPNLSNLANGDILVYDTVGAWYNTSLSSFGFATQTWVQQQGYITSSALAGYLPLTGGTVTGAVNLATNSGNVGIGTSSPFCNLHVNGKFTVYYATESAPTDDLQSSSFASFGEFNDDALWIGKNAGNIWLQAAYREPSMATYSLLLNPVGGMVGIGTASPQYKLDVNGSANATTLYENGSRVITTGNIGSQSVNYATSAGSANILGHGVSENTAHSLSNGDTLVYDAGVAWVNVPSGLSDIRQKSVISYEAEPMFEAVANAPAIRFTWKDATYSFRRGIHVGSIAQYWQTTIPEAVSMDNEGMLSMQYDVIALLSTISVAKKVSEHERRIVILERENEELRKELAALKSA